MCHGCRVLNEGFGIAEADCNGAELEGIYKFRTLLTGCVQLKGDNAAEAAVHLLLCKLVTGMTLKAGVDNALYHGMAFKEGRNPHRVLAMLFNADIKSFETAVDKESFKRPENRTGHILKAEQVALIDEFLCACRHARNNIAVTVKILGCAVDNDIRTEIEGTLEVRCCKRVVNNNLCIGAILMRDLGDCGNVDELEVRVRGRFKIESLCVGTNRSANGIEIPRNQQG